MPSWMTPLFIDKLWCVCSFSFQFIDGRLDLLNSGEGFSDVFEEEINMGEYAGKTLPMAFLVQIGLFSSSGEGMGRQTSTLTLKELGNSSLFCDRMHVVWPCEASDPRVLLF